MMIEDQCIDKESMQQSTQLGDWCDEWIDDGHNTIDIIIHINSIQHHLPHDFHWHVQSFVHKNVL